MTSTLQAPEQYLPALQAFWKRNPQHRHLILRLERKTNRHPDCDGRSWGWYEVFPLNLTVGFWGADHDDLRGVDRMAWHESAKKALEAARCARV